MSNSLSYEGKRVLVAGCFSGMGAATAKIVKDLGGYVSGFDIKKPDLDLDEFRTVNLKDAAAIEAAVGEVAAAGPIDTLLYCAGLSPVHPSFDVMQVNFLGLRNTVNACLPHMPRGASIASISSGAGMGYIASIPDVSSFLGLEDLDAARNFIADKEANDPGFGAYPYSKMCVIIYTMQQGATLASERGIRINCISPGPTATPMMPDFVETAGKKFMNRYPRPLGGDSTPEEQAWLMVFLGSDLASGLNGENIFSDGGTCGAVMTGAMDPSAIMPGPDDV